MDRRTAKITVVVLAVLFVGLLLAGTLGGGDDDQDPGCAIYSDFVADVEDPTDAEAMRVLRDVEAAAEDQEVRSFAIALRATLEDGEPISTSFRGLAQACDLDGD